MQKKYELTSNTIMHFGTKLYQIKALVSFGSVSKGELGGYVEKEKNLSQVYGDAWVYGDARVYGNAQVYGDAEVYGDARVYGDAEVYGNVEVYGDAQVYGNAQVYGDAWVSGNVEVYGTLKLITGFFFGVKWSGEKVQEIEIENGNYLIYKGDAKFGEEEPEVTEMTVAEISKALGKTVKVVGN